MLTISRNVLYLKNLQLDEMFVVVLSKFPHYWVFLQIYLYQMQIFELRIDYPRSGFLFQ